MKCWVRVSLLLALLPVLSQASDQVARPGVIAGFWQTAGGDAVIRIEAAHGQFPGRIVWLKEDRYPADDEQGMGGQAIVDRHNPDPDKRDRPVIGLQIIRKLDYRVTDKGRAEWSGGRVYDMDRGRWFDCYIWLADHDHLKLHGYLGIRALGRTTTWIRVADPRS